MAFSDKQDTSGDACKPFMPLAGKIPSSDPVFPMCRCQMCGVVFYDHLEIFPGPSLCRDCNEADRLASKAAKRPKQRHRHSW